MNIKKNELAIFEEVFRDCYYKGNTEYGDDIYFFSDSEELKKLRTNSKNLNFWDGNNWKRIEIQFKEIKKFKSYVDFDASPHPQYGFAREFSDGLELRSSNMSGHLTPYWVEN